MEPFDPDFRPNPPGIRVYMIRDDSIVVSITDLSTVEDGFIVEWKEDGTPDFIVIGELPPNASSFLHRGPLKTYVHYVYRVGVRLENDVSYSGAIKSYLPFFGPTKIVVSSLSSNSLKLSWYYYQQFETGMKIERKALPNGSYAVVSDQSSSIDTFTDTEINIGQQYRYRIYAYSPYNISYSDSLDVQYSGGTWVKKP